MTQYLNSNLGAFVTLTERELRVARGIGTYLRQESANFEEKNHSNKDGLQIQIEGAIAECVVSKYLNVFWVGGPDSGDNPDMSHGIEVRYHGEPHYGLRVREKEANNKRRMVGVWPAGLNTYRIGGWIPAEHVPQHMEWAMNPYGNGIMWAVPQQYLFALDDLKQIVRSEQ